MAQNQINIIGTHIGQMAMGNEGDVTVNQEVKKYKDGAADLKFKITDGNFTQANIGGKAVFNNTNTVVSGSLESSATQLALNNMITIGDGKPEKKVLEILRTGIDETSFKTLLEQNISLNQIAKRLRYRRNTSVETTVQRMISGTAGRLRDSDGDTTSSSDDSDFD